MPVAEPPDEVGRAAVGMPQFDDDPHPARLADMRAFHDQAIANLRVHALTIRRIPAGSTANARPAGRRRFASPALGEVAVMTTDQPPVVAGVDGSQSSLAAARYAAQLAIRRNAPLDCVCAYQLPLYGYPPMGGVDPTLLVDERARQELDTMLEGISRDLREAYPDVGDVNVRQVPGGAAAALIELSREALVTVVGSRGVGGFEELLLGSTSSQVAAHAHGPVVVVRPPITDEAAVGEPAAGAGPVLVGVDGSAEAAAALDFAVEEALSRQVPMLLLHAYWTPLHPETRDADHEGVAAAQKLLEETAAQVREGRPELDVQTRAVHTTGVEQTMIDASREAGLTVVGCRGRGGFTGVLLGSVSRALTHHAYGPVAVVHKHDRGPR